MKSVFIVHDCGGFPKEGWFPWLKTPIDFAKIKTHTREFFCVFSDNDPYVPLSDIRLFEKGLKAKTEILSKKGHFTGDDNIKKIQIVLKELLKM